jgi:hypothetical protein
MRQSQSDEPCVLRQTTVSWASIVQNVTKLRLPLQAGNFLRAWTTNSFSIKRPIPLHHVSCQAYSRNPQNFPITTDTQAYLVNWFTPFASDFGFTACTEKGYKAKNQTRQFLSPRHTTLLQLRSTAAKRTMQAVGCLACLSGFYSIWVS